MSGDSDTVRSLLPQDQDSEGLNAFATEDLSSDDLISHHDLDSHHELGSPHDPTVDEDQFPQEERFTREAAVPRESLFTVYPANASANTLLLSEDSGNESRRSVVPVSSGVPLQQWALIVGVISLMTVCVVTGWMLLAARGRVIATARSVALPLTYAPQLASSDLARPPVALVQDVPAVRVPAQAVTSERATRDTASIARPSPVVSSVPTRLDNVWARGDDPRTTIERLLQTYQERAQISFDRCEFNIAGQRGRVDCVGESRVSTGSGARSERTRHSWRFFLERLGDRWQIAQVMAD